MRRIPPRSGGVPHPKFRAGTDATSANASAQDAGSSDRETRCAALPAARPIARGNRVQKASRRDAFM